MICYENGSYAVDLTEATGRRHWVVCNDEMRFNNAGAIEIRTTGNMVRNQRVKF